MMPQLPGVLTDPLAGLVVAAVAVNALSAYLAYRLSRSVEPAVARGTRTAARERTSNAHDGDLTVECRECGAENELGYRYCRECVAEFPGAVGVELANSGTAGRLVG